MKLATWNINGIKARHERLQAWLTARQPDVVCLQEIKSEEQSFPIEPYNALGYDVALFGQKAYNGVAILSKTPLTEIERGFDDGDPDTQARFLAAKTNGILVASVYVPNGESVGSGKYSYKLAWLTRFERWVKAVLKDTELLALCGDYNVAPSSIDVHDPGAWVGSVLVSEAEREALAKVISLGLIDVYRHREPETVAYTWWDYRMLGFQKNKGLRIDHVLATPSLVKQITGISVDREARKGEKPSDHAPVVVELSI